MISLEKAFELIESSVDKHPAVSVPVASAVGCGLANEIRSPLDIPGFASSSMDGIAFRVADLEGEPPWRLTLEGVIAAGDDPRRRLTMGHCVKIMTGAPLPKGANAVVKIEEVGFESGRAVIDTKPNVGQYVRTIGDDIRRGVLVYRKGTILKSVDAGVLASIGLTTVKAIPRPKIAVLSTGSEIIKPGQPLNPGQIYNSNETTLQSLLAKDGFSNVDILPAVNDEPELILDTLKSALSSHKVVITVGGVSMGDFDFIPQIVQKLEGEVIFHKVAIKPGKPVLLAKHSKSWLIGLPGNPVSVVVSYHTFVKRLLSRLMGIEFNPETVDAKLSKAVEASGQRVKAIGTILEESEKGYIAHASVRQKSGRLSSIKSIDGIFYIPAKVNKISAGKTVKVEKL